MCGACGAGSARSATRHWSAPFLASVPARAAAARTLTAWSRTAGWSGTVAGVAGGFAVATASGRHSLAADLGEVVDGLAAYGVALDRLLDHPAVGVVEGRPTWPGLRASAAPVADLVGPVLPPDPRRRYRVPAVLAGLAVAEGAGELGSLDVRLALGETEGLALTSGRGIVHCAATPAPAYDVVAGQARVLAALLGPSVGCALTQG